MAWERLRYYGQRLQRPGLAVELARDLTRRRPGEARSWMQLAEALDTSPQLDERLAALDRAVALNPRLAEAYDLKAASLAQAGRYDEALAACRPEAFDGSLPRELQGRAAWVEARRGNIEAAIAQMTAVLKENDGYAWGWQQLGEWKERLNDTRGYVDAAEQLARVVPLDCTAFGHLGAARLKAGDREGAKQAFRHALEIAPDYSYAGSRLLELELDDGQVDEAVRWGEHLHLHFPGPESCSRLIRALAARKDRESALRRFRELWRMPCPESCGEWPWANAARALHHAGWVDETTALLQEALLADPPSALAASVWAEQLQRLPVEKRDVAPMRQRLERHPDFVEGWIALAQALRGMNRVEEELQALRRAIELRPQLDTAHDLHALALALAGRYEEALAACQPAVYGENGPPLVLRGRRAWIEHRRGKTKEAAERMAELVKEAPDYLWGLRLLVEWYDTLGMKEEYLQVARSLVSADPNDLVAFGYLGDALRRCERKDEALAVFRECVTMDPTYPYGAACLFDMQMERKDWDGARETLAVLRKHHPDSFTAMREVQWAARTGARRDALAHFRKLCAMPLEGTWALEQAVKALEETGALQDALNVLSTTLHDPQARPEAGQVYGAQMASRRRWWSAMRACQPLQTLGPAGADALSVLLKERFKAGEHWEVRWFVWRHGATVRQFPPVWGAIGYLLLSLNRYRRTVRWLSDWETFKGAEAWMVTNLVFALRSLDRCDEARAVCEKALSLPKDSTSHQFHLWIALDAALAGEVSTARSALEKVAGEEPNDYYRAVKGLAETVLRAADLPPNLPYRAFAGLRDELARALAPDGKRQSDGVLQRARRRALRRMTAGRP